MLHAFNFLRVGYFPHVGILGVLDKFNHILDSIDGLDLEIFVIYTSQPD